MSSTSILLLLPIAGGIYGACVGAYIRSPRKTPARKRVLQLVGILLVALVILNLVMAFRHND